MIIDLYKAETFVMLYYMEPHRFYHDREHITGMLHTATTTGIKLTEVQQLAILFHDIVYIAGAETGFNEEQSVEMLDVFCALNPGAVDEDSKHQAGKIILDTIDHVADYEESETVLDLDLYGLSLPWKEYIKNGELIRSEFVLFSDDIFLDGRVRFLENMLKRDRIFHTDFFYDLCEENARKNMETEVNILKNNA